MCDSVTACPRRGDRFRFRQGGKVAEHFLFVALAAGEVLVLADYFGNLLRSELITFDHRRVVGRRETRSRPQSCHHRGRDRQVLNRLTHGLDSHQASGDRRSDRECGFEWHIGSLSAMATSVIVPLNCR